ncbi:MAG: hypothetical protein K1X31_09280 [Gemmatimonadaceae bacterium]|nr:hypothetical protein [Gemmatimonadaceae bacterium]
MIKRTLQALTLTAAALVALAVRPSDARAQEHAALVWRQLNTAFETVSRDGFGSVNYIIGRMGEGKSDSWTLNFEKGVNYKIVGACDKDCSDVDIEVIDGSETIARDVLADDAPIVSFSPKTSGQLRIKVTMVKCSDEPCFFGFGLFQKS